MNVIKFELGRTKFQFLFWSLIIVAVMAMFTLTVFPFYQSAADDLSMLIDQFPPILSTTFGINKEIFSFVGFYQFISLYINILAIAMAVNLTLNIVFSEKANRAYEFILVRPITKKQLFIYKFSALLIWLVLFILLYLGAYLLMLPNGEELTWSHLWIAVSGFFLQFFIASIALIYGVSVRRIRSIPMISAMISIFFFMLNTVVRIIDYDKLSLLSPLSSFEALEIVKQGFYRLPNFMIHLSLALVLIGYGFYRYQLMEVSES